MAEYIVEYPDDLVAEVRIEECINVRERIVRCKDCKNSWTDERVGFDDDFDEYWRTDWFCTHPKTTEPSSLEVEPDGFCKWGERR